MPTTDTSKHKHGIRRPRERGISIYLTSEDLLRAGIDPDDPPPSYRVWAQKRGSVLVRLYDTKVSP